MRKIYIGFEVSRHSKKMRYKGFFTTGVLTDLAIESKDRLF
jgi:hypothetical protein